MVEDAADVNAPTITKAPSSDGPTIADSVNVTTVQADTGRIVWGILDARALVCGDQVAANGVEFSQLFALGLNFNIMVWPAQHLYLYSDSTFWGQKAGPGITNPGQGNFDFQQAPKLDFNAGIAWNYFGNWEARAFAYSFNNLNRGTSQVSPSGYNDGTGIENRYYLAKTYAQLGTSDFDTARATFLSIGYYPSKSMADASGNQFAPGFFARAYLTYDLWGEQCYLYGDVQFITAQPFLPTLLVWDAGLAVRPFQCVPRLEFRVGTQDMRNLQGSDMETSVYLGARYSYRRRGNLPVCRYAASGARGVSRAPLAA